MADHERQHSPSDDSQDSEQLAPHELHGEGGMLQMPGQRGAMKMSHSPRWAISKKAKLILEQIYQMERFPSAEMRRRLAEDFEVEPRQVQFWFQVSLRARLALSHAPPVHIPAPLPARRRGFAPARRHAGAPARRRG